MQAILLRCQIRIQPAQRGYADREATLLGDLFGSPERWGETLKPMHLATVTAVVPGFTGSSEFDLPVPCTYDLEVASTKYCFALEHGDIPLLLLFSGSVFLEAEGRLLVAQIPWEKEVSYRLPVEVWRTLMDIHFPNSGWLRLSRETLAELQAYKTRRALLTWDEAVRALLSEATGRSQA